VWYIAVILYLAFSAAILCDARLQCVPVAASREFSCHSECAPPVSSGCPSFLIRFEHGSALGESASVMDSIIVTSSRVCDSAHEWRKSCRHTGGISRGRGTGNREIEARTPFQPQASATSSGGPQPLQVAGIGVHSALMTHRSTGASPALRAGLPSSPHVAVPEKWTPVLSAIYSRSPFKHTQVTVQDG